MFTLGVQRVVFLDKEGEKMKKCLPFIIIAGIAATIGIVFFCNHRNSAAWKPLSEMKQYSKILEQPITEITLRESVDSAEWAVFDDEDLIQEWTDFLKSAEIKKEKRVSKSNSKNGGMPVATIRTKDAEFILCLEDNETLEIDNYLYQVKNTTRIPFDETFDTAVARHGFTSPWD